MCNISACSKISGMALQKHRHVMCQSLLVRELRNVTLSAREFPR